MTRLFLSVLLLCPAAAAFADPTMECSLGNGSQMEIGDCVTSDGVRVDAAVDTALGYVMDSARDLDKVTGRDDAAKALSASQKNWIAYRDAQCAYVGASYGGGSGTGIAISACRVTLGRARVAELMAMLN